MLGQVGVALSNAAGRRSGAVRQAGSVRNVPVHEQEPVGNRKNQNGEQQKERLQEQRCRSRTGRWQTSTKRVVNAQATSRQEGGRWWSGNQPSAVVWWVQGSGCHAMLQPAGGWQENSGMGRYASVKGTMSPRREGINSEQCGRTRSGHRQVRQWQRSAEGETNSNQRHNSTIQRHPLVKPTTFRMVR